MARSCQVVKNTPLTLRPKQIPVGSRHFFGLEWLGARLQGLNHLTPGNFSVVRKKAAVLDMHRDAESLIDLLHEEIRQKKENRGQRIGFGQD